MQLVQVRTDTDGSPVAVWWGWGGLRHWRVRVLSSYSLPARYVRDPVFGVVCYRWERVCWHVQLGDAWRGTLVSLPNGAWQLERARHT